MKNAQSIWYNLPLTGAGQSVGLLGGSFDPAHAGHVHITQAALKRFDLDHIWWLVSPGNPLKSSASRDLSERVRHAREIMADPRVTVTGIEAALDTRYTANTLRALTKLQPRTRFVWLMGADNLAQFHHWQDWQFIMQTVPVGILARPGSRAEARNSVAARRFASARIPGWASRRLSYLTAPAWCFVNIPLNPLSSTALRQERAGKT